MKCDNLYHEFKKYEGQPVKIYTDDGRVQCGIDLAAFEDAVRILDKCGRTILVDYAHIDAVVEPQMKLSHACRDKDCGCCGDGNGIFDNDDDDNERNGRCCD